MANEPFVPVDPMEFARVMWPDVYFYSKQREIIYSVENNNITVVPAANKMGKDFVAGFLALSYFLRHPVVRVITTSVKDDHLRVLWSEISRYVRDARFKLVDKKIGCLSVLHRDITKYTNNVKCPVSYLRGMVSERGEGLAGHHAPYTLAIVDEASGIDDIVFTQLETWAKRILVIGNPLPTTNIFYKWVKEGDVKAPTTISI
jgi:hypothetical protein